MISLYYYSTSGYVSRITSIYYAVFYILFYQNAELYKYIIMMRKCMQVEVYVDFIDMKIDNIHWYKG